MLEVKEVLRLWVTGVRKKRIAAQLGLNVKTVRRYLRAAQAHGLTIAAHPDALDDGLPGPGPGLSRPGHPGRRERGPPARGGHPGPAGPGAPPRRGVAGADARGEQA